MIRGKLTGCTEAFLPSSPPDSPRFESAEDASHATKTASSTNVNMLRVNIPSWSESKVAQAAAVTQEFKEAARLAAEAKACVGEADACDKRAAQARADAEHARLASESHEGAVTREHATIARAKLAVALAQWRRQQVGMFTSHQQRPWFLGSAADALLG